MGLGRHGVNLSDDLLNFWDLLNENKYAKSNTGV